MNPLQARKALKQRGGLSLLLALVLLLLPTIATAQVNPSADQEEQITAIESYIESRMQELRIPGLALAIVQADQIVYGRGFGVTGPDGQAVTPQTPFQIASLTKPMTGVAIMQLVEAGQLELDAPVQRYLPWFRMADEAASAEITVRHLLYHTSGLPETLGVELFGKGDARPHALDEWVRSFDSVQLNRSVGGDYEYANAGYAILGLLIETVSGQSYESYLQTQLFTPLQMRQSFTDWAAAQDHGAASGHQYWFGRPIASDLPVNRAQVPAGGVTASVEDIAHFLIAQLNGGRYGEATLLSAAGIAEMQRPIAPVSADEFYAMDWGVRQIGGETIIAKGGAWADFKSQMVLIPARRLGVVVLMNANKPFDATLGDLRLPMIPFNVVEMLLDQPMTVFPASNLLTVIYAVLFLALAVQVGGMTRTIRRLRRWQRQPEERPAGWRLGLVHLVLPLLVNLGWGLGALLWPRLFNASLTYAIYTIPDVSYTLLISGVVALAWAVVRTAWLFGLLRTSESQTPVTIGAPIRSATGG